MGLDQHRHAGLGELGGVVAQVHRRIAVREPEAAFIDAVAIGVDGKREDEREGHRAAAVGRAHDTRAQVELVGPGAGSGDGEVAVGQVEPPTRLGGRVARRDLVGDAEPGALVAIEGPGVAGQVSSSPTGPLTRSPTPADTSSPQRSSMPSPSSSAKSTKAASKSSICPPGESCRLTNIGGRYGSRCFTKPRSGDWGSVSAMGGTCNAYDPLDANGLSFWESGLCLGFGCAAFCDQDSDCAVNGLDWRCDEEPGQLFPSLPELRFRVCFPRGCDSERDCSDGSHRRMSWSGEETRWAAVRDAVGVPGDADGADLVSRARAARSCAPARARGGRCRGRRRLWGRAQPTGDRPSSETWPRKNGTNERCSRNSPHPT